MSISETEKIDFIGLDPQSSDVILAISDHLDWREAPDEHLLLLQEKLNAYLRFAESGEVYSHVPLSTSRKVRFRVVGKYPLSDAAKKFYVLAEKSIKDAGFTLTFEQHEPGSTV